MICIDDNSITILSLDNMIIPKGINRSLMFLETRVPILSASAWILLTYPDPK